MKSASMLDITGKSFVVEAYPDDVAEFDRAHSLLEADSRIDLAFKRRVTLADHARAAKSIGEIGFPVWPHIAARHILSTHDLDSFLGALTTEAGVDSCVVIAGHTPEPEGPFSDTRDIIRSGLMQKHGIKRVAVAAHPSGHLNFSAERVHGFLREKLDLLTNEGFEPAISTQFELDSRPVTKWLENLRNDEVKTPVHIGLLAPAPARRLKKVLDHADFPITELSLREFRFADTDPATVLTPDNLLDAYCDELDPAKHGEVQFHLAYGEAAKTAGWIRSWLGGTAP